MHGPNLPDRLGKRPINLPSSNLRLTAADPDRTNDDQEVLVETAQPRGKGFEQADTGNTNPISFPSGHIELHQKDQERSAKHFRCARDESKVSEPIVTGQTRSCSLGPGAAQFAPGSPLEESGFERAALSG
jgi:hypothetical protein